MRALGPWLRYIQSPMSDIPAPPPSPEPSQKQHSFGATATAGLAPLKTDLPAPKWHVLLRAQLARLVRKAAWTSRLAYRWLRPRYLRPALIYARTALREAIKAPLQPLFQRSTWQIWAKTRGKALKRSLKDAAVFLLGWAFWYWRRLKTNRDTRLATLGLGAGFSLSLLVLVLVLRFLPIAQTPIELPIDPNVPVPDIALIEADANSTEAEVTLPSDRQTLSPDNFRFELFVQRQENGQIRLLSQAAEAYIRRWFPNGTPAVNVMQFLGQSWIRSGFNDGTPAEATKSRCIALPIGKVFRQNTITCTFGHPLPGPALPRENSKLRLFWIVSLTNDGAGRLTDLRVHARTTEAQR